MTDYFCEAACLKDDLIAIRRHLHQIPELGLDLPLTTAFVQEELTKLGIPSVKSPSSGWVSAVIGDPAGRCILLRSDMDALPVTEDSGLAFASSNGCMHACGHDFHTTNLLGAARLLKAHESELKGQVKLFFQTGEEVFDGSLHAISEGLLEDPCVDATFGMHMASRVPVGVIRASAAGSPRPMSSLSVSETPSPSGQTGNSTASRAVMSAGYCFRIEITGKGAHGSTPELGISPINAAVHIYLGLHELIAREVAASKEAVLTIGRFESGQVFNVIPDTAVMEGTLRTFDPEVRSYLIGRFNDIIPQIAAVYRAEAKIIVIGDCPPVINDPVLEDEVLSYIHESNPAIDIRPTFHWMASEDFSFFGDHVPSCFLSIGGMADDGYPAYAEHNPKVRFNEGALTIGAAVYASVAAKWLEAHS